MIRTSELKLENIGYTTYTRLKNLGMLWVTFPEATGIFENDVKVNVGDEVIVDPTLDASHTTVTEFRLLHGTLKDKVLIIDEIDTYKDQTYLRFKSLPGFAYKRIFFVKKAEPIKEEPPVDAVITVTRTAPIVPVVIELPVQVDVKECEDLCEDITGRKILLGDKVVYGTSGNGKLKIGIITDCLAWSGDYRAVKVKGEKSSRAGLMPFFNTKEQMLVINV